MYISSFYSKILLERKKQKYIWLPNEWVELNKEKKVFMCVWGRWEIVIVELLISDISLVLYRLIFSLLLCTMYRRKKWESKKEKLLFPALRYIHIAAYICSVGMKNVWWFFFPFQCFSQKQVKVFPTSLSLLSFFLLLLLLRPCQRYIFLHKLFLSHVVHERPFCIKLKKRKIN